MFLGDSFMTDSMIRDSDHQVHTAIAYLRAGLCVLPAIVAEKRPSLPAWKQYQQRLPTKQQIAMWFASDTSLCILTGAVSGNLEMIDFDHQAELFDCWKELVSTETPGLVDRLVVERSASPVDATPSIAARLRFREA